MRNFTLPFVLIFTIFYTSLFGQTTVNNWSGQNIYTEGKPSPSRKLKTKPSSSNEIKAVTLNVFSNNGYVAGETHNLYVTFIATNEDFEYVDSVSITLPSGMTLNSVSNNEFFGPSDGFADPEAYNGIDGQTVSWGDNDNDYGGIVALGSVYQFTMNVTFDASLSGDQVIDVFASGDEFDLFGEPGDASASIVLSEEDSEARLQVIHNSADAAATTVDVRVNGNFPDPSLDDVDFRTATPFLTVPALTDLDISVNAPESTDDSNALFSQLFNLDPGITYVVVADGIVSSSGYTPDVPFSLEAYAVAREQASIPSNTDILVHHGATDAPAVDVVEPFLGVTLVNDLGYSEFQGYIEVPTGEYFLQVTTADGSNVVENYSAPLADLGLEGSAITVLASGFLNPADNSDGPAFGLWVALPSGGPLVELQTEALAYVQVIHNSPDAAAAEVDVRINGGLPAALDNLPFRFSTPFLPIVVGEALNITVNAPDSEDDSNPLFQLQLPEGLNEDERYLIIAEGILSETGYDPGSGEVPFALNVYNPAQQASTTPGNVDVLVSHGATDAPAVDVNELTVPVPELVNNISFGEIQGYLDLAVENYILEVALESNNAVVNTYSAPLELLQLGNSAITVLASGFVDPSVNSNGPAFGLFVATPAGGQLVELGTVVPNDSPCEASSLLTDGTPSDIINTSGATVDGNEVVPISGDCEGLFSWCDGVDEGEPASLDNTIWFSFTAPASGAVEVTSCLAGTDFDTQIAVWAAGDCTDYATFNLVAANDDYPADQECESENIFASRLTACGLEEGITYYVQVDGYDGETGDAQIAVIELASSVCTARLQVVHNSPDDAAAVVDIRVNGEFPAADFNDLEFRNATATIDAPAGVPLDISINAPGSIDASDPILLAEGVILTPGSSYQVTAQGIVSETGYDPGSDEAPLELIIVEGYAEESGDVDVTDILVVHGSPDAPAVDVDEIDVLNAELVGNISYGDVDGYASLTTDNYTIGITAAGASDILAAFAADLAELNLGGVAITVYASGFLDPSVNSDGPAFGLWASLPTGGPLVPLQNVTSVDHVDAIESYIVYPNPADQLLMLDLQMIESSRISIDFVNLVGQVVKTVDLGQRSTGLNREQIDIQDLATGLYLMNITFGNDQVTHKVQIWR